MFLIDKIFKRKAEKAPNYKRNRTPDDYKLKKFFWDGNKYDTGNKFIEATAYDMLSKHISEEFILIPHVSLKEIFSVKHSGSEYYFYLSYLATHHVDLLILDRRAARPVCAIEIDGSYHYNDEAQMRSDEFKNSLFALHKIPLVRIDLKEDVLNLRYYIEKFRKDTFIRPVYHETCHTRMERKNGPHGWFFSCPRCKRTDGKPQTISINKLPEIFYE